LPAPSLPPMIPVPASGRSYFQLTLRSRGLYMAVHSDPTYGVPPESFNQLMGDGPVDAYVLDETNYAAWKEGKPSTALWGVENVGSEPVTLCGPAPATGKAYLVFSAPDHLVIGPSINAELSVRSMPGAVDAGADASKPDAGPSGAEPSQEAGPIGEAPGAAIEPSGSCGCRTSSSSSSAGAALFALGCLMLRARRRRDRA